MYTITIYFDEKTNRTIQNYINQIAKVTGNMYMLDNNVPPHITLSAFDTKNEMAVAEVHTKNLPRLLRLSVLCTEKGEYINSVNIKKPSKNL